MIPINGAFAIPGDLNTRTGGYIYERRMLESLPQVGQPVQYIPLISSFPDPTDAAISDAATRLRALGPDTVLILDGLVFGSIDTEVLASLACPVVAMLHHPLGLEAGLPPARAAALIARERDNLRHAAHVVVPSAHTRDILIAQFGVPADRISVAPPGFDRPPTGVVQTPPADPPLILSVGLICRRKGHDVLLDALARLRHLDWQAAIVGMTHDEGVYQALLHQRAALGLEGRVRFTGEVSAETLDQLWRQAHVFALATRYEGYGMVLSEAQLYGLPMVSCAVGAVPQHVPSAAAALTAPDDAPAFTDALARLLTDVDHRAGMAAASRAGGQRLPHWYDAACVMRDAMALARHAQQV
ncbi:glycosyltransferase family 4 protein [Roseicitreum antarcticum]|uniref:Glycosyltransferase involved in cell wall bisynthesis n=1 Tax=Roseicitreum antarcticum TaxID=564137 RepID=A0A1H2ZD99_9RHOB|nr:glycosyltransferase family 4 protein [Roseicitreum antarcticum]SDX15370.1 Glycosyltransferase involved in cell wall bisynthesis [Roseicitreum antarcticum]